MGKKGQISLFESYASSLQPNEDYDDNIPLPDSMRTSTLLEQIGKERGWTDEQVDEDIDVLEKNRLYLVRDLRVLSNQSWEVIGILPLVRDLLRQAIHPKQQVMNGSTDTWMEQDYKTEKKKKKKEKKEKKKKMGEPVVFGGRDEIALASNTDPLLASSPDVMKDVLSEDPETIRNTIRNGSIDVGKEESLEELALQQGGDQQHHSKKSVSFSGADNNNGNNKKASKACDSTDDSSSSSSSSSSSEDDAMVTKRSSYSSSASSFGLRPIKPVGNNRIQVKTATGDVYECDRFCPHKGVDLSTWGQVLGNTLVCTKHNWRFGLEGGAGNKGRNIHPCKVNDW